MARRNTGDRETVTAIIIATMAALGFVALMRYDSYSRTQLLIKAADGGPILAPNMIASNTNLVSCDLYVPGIDMPVWDEDKWGRIPQEECDERLKVLLDAKKNMVRRG